MHRVWQISRFLFLGALLACLVVCLLAARRRPMPVLMYHHIVEDAGGKELGDMTVTADRFREDMRWLIDNGYTFVLPRELAAGDPLPRKPVMVTFDDGYRSSYSVLFPILREMDVKAALAMVVSKTDREQDIGFLSWEMCREMAESGLVEFGSHSYDLHNFDGREGDYVPGAANGIVRKDGESREEYEARVFPDLQRSIDAIEGNVGGRVCYFAFPFGETDEWADRFIREHFSVTTLTRAGVADLYRGLYGLERLTITMERSVQDCL